MRSEDGEDPGSEGRITDEDEIRHYDHVSASRAKRLDLEQKVARTRSAGSRWGEPMLGWIDSVHDAASQVDVYRHLAPVIRQGTVVQIGGTGQAALKALVGGAPSAVLVTPSPGEAALADEVAAIFGLSERFEALVGFAEDLPVESRRAASVISEGCLHHTNVPAALREAARVLGPGGRFGSWDPWKARLYELGIRVFGKRDPDVDCRPMDRPRVQPLAESFPSHSEVVLHGALTRYPGIVWSRFVRPISVTTSLKITKIDDRLSGRVRVLARNGSSCALLGIK